ncbi:helix-turn-helix domain-containing protein [Mucilaginibacter sp. UYCu711]|uniref:helix-turn-helix domain-containing protein n=1 Tax=Mucilaginibacter sp. UYCu711 TaxID=3156339 RepID=UPI003D22B836
MAKQNILQLDFKEDISLGFEFIAIDDHYARTKPNLRRPHRASFYLILWFKNGNPVHTVDFHPVKPPVDSFLFVRKDAVQFFDLQNTFQSSTLLFTDTFFCENEHDYRFLRSSQLFNSFVGDEAPIPIVLTQELRTLWQWMQTEEQHPFDPFHAALLRKYLHSFLLRAEREKLKQGKGIRMEGANFESLINFNNLLEEHFRNEKGLSFYADKLFISTKVLNNITHLMLGKTPKQLIDERVQLEAKRLLVHTEIPIKTISLYLGFDETTNFNKFFKKHSGQTPAVFRNTFLLFTTTA